MNNKEDKILPTWLIVTLIVIAVLVILLVVLYFAGRKLQKKQNEQQALLEANKQTVTMLVIDKKRMKLKDANMPQAVMSQIPKISRNVKVPLVKVKAGTQVLTMFCDEKIFDLVPVKKEVKAEVSGMYIVGIKGLHGTAIKKDEVKKGFWARALEKAQEKAGSKPIK